MSEEVFKINSRDDISKKLSVLLGISNDNSKMILKLIQDIVLQNFVDEYRLNIEKTQTFHVPFYDLGDLVINVDIRKDGRYAYNYKVTNVKTAYKPNGYFKHSIYKIVNENYDPLYGRIIEKLNDTQFDKYLSSIREALNLDD